MIFFFVIIGTTIRLDPWEGWLTFLHGCLLGHRLAVQGHLSEEKLVMRSDTWLTLLKLLQRVCSAK